VTETHVDVRYADRLAVFALVSPVSTGCDREEDNVTETHVDVRYADRLAVFALVSPVSTGCDREEDNVTETHVDVRYADRLAVFALVSLYWMIASIGRSNSLSGRHARRRSIA
jgi:hypothetical protein